MVRIKRGNIAVKRRKKAIRLAKGYIGSNSRLSRFAGEQVIQSLNFAYIGRKLKKRSFRKIWIYRINAAARSKGTTYSNLLGALRNQKIYLNRKVLAFFAFNDLPVFNLLTRYLIK